MNGSNPPYFFEPVGFQDRLAAWIQLEQPAVDLIVIVAEWIKRRADDPYGGVIHRQTDIAANLWWTAIPGTFRDGADVMCSFWIDEELRQIRCDSIATLSRHNP